MDKLKKVFSPGSKKDDEVLYGDAEARRQSAGKAAAQEPEQLHAVEGSDKKEHSILRQIVNPGGEKYDDQRYGTTATTSAPDVDPTKLQTHPEAEKKQHTILDQVLNPNHDKYDEQRFTETAATSGDRRSSIPATEAPPVVADDAKLQTDPGQKDHSILRQIINPHGDKYDEQGYGNTSHVAGDVPSSILRSDPTTNPDRSITRQILNPGQEKYDPVAHGSSQPTAGAAGASSATASHIAGTGSGDQTLSDRTTAATAPTAGSHHDRDAALAGGLVAAGGAGTYAATGGDGPAEKITDRPHPLSDKAAETGSNPATTSSNPVGPAGGAHINPVGAPEQSLTSSTNDSHLGRDAAVAGGVTAAGATGAAATTQLNSAPSDVQNATYTVRTYPVGGGAFSHTSGPHPTDAGNKLDPHVPGEFPTESGEDKHGVNNPTLDPVATGTSDTNKNTGIVGAIAGFAGLGGLVGGAAAANKDEHDKSAVPAEPEHATAHPGGSGYPIQTTTNTLQSASPDAQGTPAASGEKSSEHHYGKDAAVAGGLVGAGAAGAGIHEATKDQSSTAPAAANAPATATTETTSHSAAPREAVNTSTVQQTTKPEDQKEDHHYGRDAAIAGGAGAAGAAVVAASRDQPADGGHTVHLMNRPEDEVDKKVAPTQSVEGGHTVYILDHPKESQEDKKAQKAREEESEKSSEQGEKKHGLLHRILHPGRKSEDKERRLSEDKEGRRSHDQEARKSVDQNTGAALNHPIIPPEDIKDKRIVPEGSQDKRIVSDDNRVATDEKGHSKLHKKSIDREARGYEAAAAQSSHIGTDGAIGRDNEVSGTLDPTIDRKDETVIEPHTGLPMNVGKYGYGSGGTDGATQISGYHETDPVVRKASIGTAENAGTKGPSHHPGEEGVAGPDWDKIKKENTPY